MGGLTYKDAGVDLERYRDAMSRLPRLMHRTFGPRVLPNDGAFAGLFQLDFKNPLFARNYQQPVLVACTDGVGTKLKVASLAGVHHTVGVDLVAMCVNDAICCGAEPLFFLDYVAMDKDDPPRLEQIVSGISQGCWQADCALLGGETAIMPDLYRPGEYDLAGFCVGVADQRNLIRGDAIKPGDKILGLASSGIHSNGYSLVRKVVFETARLSIHDEVAELGSTVGQALLTPTTIYVRAVRAVLQHYNVKRVVHGIAHITGGGLRENLARSLPEGVHAVIHGDAWPVPPVFRWLQRLGKIDHAEMERVFNMGIGLTLVVSDFYANSIRGMIEASGLACWEIGEIRDGPRGVSWA